MFIPLPVKSFWLAIAILAAPINPTSSVASEVNLYSYREPQHVEPLLRAFQAATGIEVKTTFAPLGLIERLVLEGESSPADILLTNDFAPLLEARQRGLTQAFKSDVVEANVPAVYRDPERHWFGITRRARVFIVSDKRIADRPMTYEELAEPQWKGKICIRSGLHAYNVGLVASMLAHHGPAWTENWLRGLAANLARKPSGGDRDQISAVVDGVCDLAVVNSYYAADFFAAYHNPMQLRRPPIRLLLPNATDRGTHVSISGVALLKRARNKEGSIKLIEFLTSVRGQQIYSAINDEYPVNVTVPMPSLEANREQLKPDPLPLHRTAELRHDALTLIERTRFDQGPEFGNAAGALAGKTGARTKIRFALDWRFEGPAAPFLIAIDRGYYDQEGLEVTIDQGNGSVESVQRVATGAHDMGFADINSLIKYRSTVDSAALKAVLIGYNAPPFAIVTLKRNKIAAPKDLEGRVLGAPASDGAYAQWPIFVLANGIDASKVKIENVGFPDREKKLAEGKVDAITSFWFSSFLTLIGNGIAHDDISVMLMSDHGLDLYGNAVIASPSLMKADPEAVAAFVRATIRGMHDTIASPDLAIKSVMKRNAAADEKIELERLKMVVARNFVTSEVLLNGLGDVDQARLEHSIQQIGAVFPFAQKPNPADIFTGEFLPARALRILTRD